MDGDGALCVHVGKGQQRLDGRDADVGETVLYCGGVLGVVRETAAVSQSALRRLNRHATMCQETSPVPSHTYVIPKP